MTDSIICPNCKNNISLPEILSHQNEEKLNLERIELREKAKKWKEEQEQKMEEERRLHNKEIEEKAIKRTKAEIELQMKDTQNESEEVKKNNIKLQDQLLELTKTLRQQQNALREKDIENEKKLAQEQEKIRQEEQKRMEEQYRLRDMEKEKKLQDMTRQIEDLKRKAEQGSQQMQGEVLELAVEGMLQKEFPFDEIKPVPKGKMGADIIQLVKLPSGKVCGTIIWEMKRTKSWGGDWIEKLKMDQRSINAELAVIVSQFIPDSIRRFGVIDDIWICEFDCLIGVAYALRSQIIELQKSKSSMDGQKGKTDLLYQYITSTAFKHRMETIVETFSSMQEEITKERNFFVKKWARQEQHLRSVLDNTLGMHGDLQGIMGKSIGELKTMEELPETIESQPDGKLF